MSEGERATEDGDGVSQAIVILEPTIIIEPPTASSMLIPKLIADAGEQAALRFLDFFTANIRNPNTRAAYAVAVRAFFAWLDAKQVAPLTAVRTHHVSAYVELLAALSRADRQAAPGGDPHAVRLAHRRPDFRRPQSGRRRARAETRRQKRQDAGARRRRSEKADRLASMSRRSSGCATAR